MYFLSGDLPNQPFWPRFIFILSFHYDKKQWKHDAAETATQKIMTKSVTLRQFSRIIDQNRDIIDSRVASFHNIPPWITFTLKWAKKRENNINITIGANFHSNHDVCFSYFSVASKSCCSFCIPPPFIECLLSLQRDIRYWYWFTASRHWSMSTTTSSWRCCVTIEHIRRHRQMQSKNNRGNFQIFLMYPCLNCDIHFVSKLKGGKK